MLLGMQKENAHETAVIIAFFAAFYIYFIYIYIFSRSLI